MALGSSEIGLLFRVRGDATSGINAIKDTERAAKELSNTAEATNTSFLKMATAAGVGETAGRLLGEAFLFIGREAIAAATSLFTLSKNTADFGSAIFDASEKTGLSAERLSALKFAADQSGSSLEQITTGITRFAKTLDDAASGNDAAVEKLKRLGVTSTDVDTALKQALATIVKMKPGAEQTAAAMAAFGTKIGADLLPTIKSFDGDLDKVTQTAKEFGATINDEAAKQADEFNDTLDILTGQVAGLGRQIGITLIPRITELAKSLSTLVKENQTELQTWGTNAGRLIQGVIGYWEDLRKKIKEYRDELERIGNFKVQDTAPVTGGIDPNSPGQRFGKYLGDLLQNRGQSRQNQPDQQASNVVGNSTAFKFKSNEEIKAELDQQAEAEKAREEARKRDLASQKEHIKLLLDAQSEEFKGDQKGFEEAFKNREIAEDQYRETSERNYEIYAAKVKKLILDAFKLDAQGKNAAEIANLRLAKDAANTAVDNEIARQREARDKLFAGANEKETKERLDAVQDQLDGEIDPREAANDLILAQNETALKQGLITEEEFAKKRRVLELSLSELKLTNLKKLRDAFAASGKDTIAIDAEIATQEKRNQAERERVKAASLVSVKELNDALQKQLEIEQDILAAERRILDVRANQVRNQLKTAVNISTPGPQRQAALAALRDLELSELARKKKQDEEDLAREKARAIASLSILELQQGDRERVEQLYRDKALEAEEEFQQRLAEIRQSFNDDIADEGFFQNFVNNIGEGITTVDLLTGAFNSLASGIASAVQQYVLYGKTAPAVLRQVLAATLAQIAAEAAVQAIKAAALGFVALAVGDYSAATFFFTGAALWGSIAVGAALLGRAVAPKQATAATASAASGAGGTGASQKRDTSDQGKIYSSKEGRELSTNAPQQLEIVFKEKPGWFSDALKMEIRGNQGFRQELKLVAQE